jgi:hypothetical protein
VSSGVETAAGDVQGWAGLAHCYRRAGQSQLLPTSDPGGEFQMTFKASRRIAGLIAATLAAAPHMAGAQVALPPASPAAAVAAPIPPAAQPTPAPTKIKLREGEELVIRFEDPLSSGSNTAGDQFSISLDEDMKLADGTVIRAGYRGRGEVTDAKKKGFMGQAGELNVRLNYLRLGDARVRLRASKGGEGKGAMGATIALTVLFGPLGLLKRGHDIEIKPGQTLTAFVDQDAELELPLPPPPQV